MFAHGKGGEFGWERRRVEPVLLGQGVAAVARFRSAHALVMKCLRRVGEGSTERVPQCARSHIEQVDSIPAQAVKAFLDSGARAACRANGCRSIGLNSEAEALMVWRQQRS